MIRWTIAPAIFCMAMPTFAAPVTNLNAVDSQVAAFTGAVVGTPGGALAPVDRRLRLAECSQPLALSWYGSAQASVLVECAGSNGWRIYVPVARNTSTGFAGNAAIPVVARGDAVTITVQGDGFAVSQPGEAMEAGAVGAWIKVRTLGTAAQPMRAQVQRPGLVSIDLP